MRILVTGASGFVGRRLVPVLRQAFPNAELVLTGASGKPEAKHEGVSTMIGSLLDPLHCIDLARTRPDLVIHLAARSSVAGSLMTAFDTMAVNLGGTMRLAEALRSEAAPAGFVLASSAEVYGMTFNDGPATEDSPLRPANAYARSKAASEWALADMLGDESCVCTLRLFNHSGPGQDERFVIPAFAAQIARAEKGLADPVVRVGNLSAERDFLHVDDVLEAYVEAARYTLGAGPGAKALNIASGQARSVQSVLDGLLGLARVEVRIETDPARLRPSEVPVAVGDASLARTCLGWTPHRSFESLLKDLLEYWRAQYG